MRIREIKPATAIEALERSDAFKDSVKGGVTGTEIWVLVYAGERVSSITESIQRALVTIEGEEGVRVLYACESGSRAWGFASKDSDYDVRFLYVHPPAWYLTIQRKPDSIERPIDAELDLAGWDLRKALELLRKSNPPLLEWLQSPIVYRNEGSAWSLMRGLVPVYWSPLACMYHYLHMGRRQVRDYLHGETVSDKKTLYALRSVLACLWIERDIGPVPMEFQVLVDRLVDDLALRAAIERLLGRKRQGVESDKRRPLREIMYFLERELGRFSVDNHRQSVSKDPVLLDRLFVDLLVEGFGPNIR